MGHARPRKAVEAGAKLGRPPAGDLGQKVSGYSQMTVRLPQATKARLDAIAGMTGMPLWRVIDRALNAYVIGLPLHERRVLVQLQERRAREN